MHLRAALLAGAACWTQAVWAEAEALPSQILPVVIADLEATTTLLVDKAAVETGLYSSHSDGDLAAQDLRLKARAKGQKEEEEEEADDDDEKSSNYGSGSNNSSKGNEDEDDQDDEKSDSRSKDRDENDDDDDDGGDSKSEKTGTMTISVPATSSSEAPAMSTLPVAFDNKAASEFKTLDEDDSCPNFIDGLLNSKEFQRCYPLSMMLQTSQGFFQAMKNLVSIVRVLDATCAADLKECSQFMRSAAQNLTSPDHCESEWNDGLATVSQAYRGLMAYEMMYTATCLQDPDTENYCFATAVSNVSTISDTYLYFLPYNLSLPGSSTPSCDWCVEETMGVFHSATANRKQLVSINYESAARQVNTVCGSDFVNQTLADESESFAVLTAAPSAILLSTTVMLAVALGVAV